MVSITTSELTALVGRLRGSGCVFAEDEAAVLCESAVDHERLEAMVLARVRGVALEHVVGWADFAGLRIPIDPGVFVPRRRTEHLLAVAVGLARRGDLVLDLCCGSGAIARVLHAQVPDLRLHAADLHPAAVASARRTLAGIADVHQGDLYAALPQSLAGRVDLLVANVPYVPSGRVATLPRDAREHVDPVTVDGGPDGLSVLARVMARAREWLAPGAPVLCEVAADQVDPALERIAAVGLVPSVEHEESLDAHVVIGRRVRAPRPGADL